MTGPGSASAPVPAAADGPVCAADGPCVTCGDVAVELTVVRPADSDAMSVDGTSVDRTSVDGMSDQLRRNAFCRDDSGREELVALDLVGPVRPGDRVLVHAGVAITRLPSDRFDRPWGPEGAC